MTTNVPASVIVSCDSCGRLCSDCNRRQSGGLILKQDALDYQGSPCANGSRTFDLCDDCLEKMRVAVNAVMTAARVERTASFDGQ